MAMLSSFPEGLVSVSGFPNVRLSEMAHFPCNIVATPVAFALGHLRMVPRPQDSPGC